MDFFKLTHDKLSVEAIMDLVVLPSCGAVSVFVGTTRDNFEEKTVVHLEYEAYDEMALETMHKICSELRKQWPSVGNVAIYHRLGTVPVKDASIVIAVSSPHRADAMLATQWCIENVKKSVPIWKKEVYSGGEEPEWKENKESNSYPPKIKKFKLNIKQEVQVPYIPPHLLKIKASNEDIDERIQKFMEHKREEINRCNVRDFCRKEKDAEDDYSCARIDSVLIKRKDSKGHLQVNRVYNNYSRDQNNTKFLMKFLPKNGIDERLENLETNLSLKTPVSKDVYFRLKQLEERLLHLESISPEYVQFWDRNLLTNKPRKRKKIFSLDEIDSLISDLEMKKLNQKK